mmetsp:Transcript_23904/g.70565  ORF Transcript_23904/g.70565 Transcript_23904/m.70565 type:complete len:224 (-) Transcript_23904:340-1011(-)|eukprot:CAMPEP_0113528848 /NCGR_PEP_ID=MMETSP0015_2-20120614/2067_1 /TAXON_ID=2838 /ORGANISM="Odontella" /LENGTH=223 /DNA_ID=CAMNT_0000427415 /DNA_START=124 /DNA_END=795 /DNA_ORIENTATION=- /assembly_acc=CAM_ASM_000160
MRSTVALVLASAFGTLLSVSVGFQPSPNHRPALDRRQVVLNYEPKWKKKLTIAEQAELDGKEIDPEEVGLKGTVNVIFQQGSSNKTTVAMPGQPLRDVASQAGQFIQYGCGKGECGTCEALCGGKWIRPCTALVPADIESGTPYVVQVKDVKAKSTSSGTFFSVKSFFKGFWNNLLGMAGFVRDRRKAKKNWEEREEYEDTLAQMVAEKKAARAAARKASKEN